MGLRSFLMERQTPYHIEKLLEAWHTRRRQNPAFSLRAYARYLSVQPPTLSAVLRNKRPLPKKTTEAIARKLGLSPMEEQAFRESARTRDIPPPSSGAPRELLDTERHFRIIAEWEYFAVLSLAHLKGFSAKPTWISKRLGIGEARAGQVVRDLQKAGLMANGKRTFKAVTTSEDIASRALRVSHAETLDLARQKLEEVPLDLRDYSSEVFCVNARALPALKQLIRDFRAKVTALADSEANFSDVYELAIQLFPLTKVQRREIDA